MGGGDLNTKKSWHPNTFKNQERVWKAEQAAENEKRKIAELQKEVRSERSREELLSLGQRSGALPAGDPNKLDWMYSQPSKSNNEDYLLGKVIDKTYERSVAEEKKGDFGLVSAPKNHVEHEVIPFSIRNFRGQASVPEGQVDLARKLQEDPLAAIKRRELEARAQLLQNPLRLQQLTKLLRQDQEKRKEKKEKKKDKKKKSDIDRLLAEKLTKLQGTGKSKIDLASLLSDGGAKRKKKNQESDSECSSDAESSDSEKIPKRRKKKKKRGGNSMSSSSGESSPERAPKNKHKQKKQTKHLEVSSKDKAQEKQEDKTKKKKKRKAEKKRRNSDSSEESGSSSSDSTQKAKKHKKMSKLRDKDSDDDTKVKKGKSKKSELSLPAHVNKKDEKLHNEISQSHSRREIPRERSRSLRDKESDDDIKVKRSKSKKKELSPLARVNKKDEKSYNEISHSHSRREIRRERSRSLRDKESYDDVKVKKSKPKKKELSPPARLNKKDEKSHNETSQSHSRREIARERSRSQSKRQEFKVSRSQSERGEQHVVGSHRRNDVELEKSQATKDKQGDRSNLQPENNKFRDNSRPQENSRSRYNDKPRDRSRSRSTIKDPRGMFKSKDNSGTSKDNRHRVESRSPSENNERRETYRSQEDFRSSKSNKRSDRSRSRSQNNEQRETPRSKSDSRNDERDKYNDSRSVNHSKEVKKAPSNHSAGARPKLSEDEKERRLREMISDAADHDKERARNLQKHRATERRDEELARKQTHDPLFAAKQIRAAPPKEDISARLNATRARLQRDHSHMDRNFARR